jgi:Reverse transcriptase (RNA-dependent DNA polymerase)
MALFVMANWTVHVIEVRGAFLKGNFEDNELRYLEVQEDFEKHYKEGTVLELKRTIHGLKHASFAFWKELLIAFKSMGFRRSKAEPCLCVKNSENGVVLWISWVDNCMLVKKTNDGVF